MGLWRFPTGMGQIPEATEHPQTAGSTFTLWKLHYLPLAKLREVSHLRNFQSVLPPQASAPELCEQAEEGLLAICLLLDPIYLPPLSALRRLTPKVLPPRCPQPLAASWVWPSQYQGQDERSGYFVQPVSGRAVCEAAKMCSGSARHVRALALALDCPALHTGRCLPALVPSTSAAAAGTSWHLSAG